MGVYIECDYMVTSLEEEDFFFAQNERLRTEQGIEDGVYCHYDTPCAVDSQIGLLMRAGFAKVDMLWREGNTTLIMARKAGGSHSNRIHWPVRLRRVFSVNRIH